jgi:DNA mismatch endonuclease (patch repair protein)
MMSGIKGKNTKPEMTLRHGLHALGFRYRLHDRRLPGKPDLVFPKYRAVIFVHGCFWHGHDCHLFKLPQTRTEFWQEKIRANRNRDEAAYGQIVRAGWRIAEIWECASKGKTRIGGSALIRMTAEWLRDGSSFMTIAGTRPNP